jgi:uncharacterized membrane protein
LGSVATDDECSGRKGYGLERLLALSDGVFAFAVTLLVLDLVVPTLSPGASSGDLFAALSAQYVSFLNYLLSFFIAGVWWNAHHRNFGYIRGANSGLRWLNLLFLLWIALLPFFTKILDGYSYLQGGVALYAVDQAAAGICLMLSWWYASREHRFVDEKMTPRAIRFVLIRNAIAPIFFIASMGITFVSPQAATLSWFGMIPILALASQLEKRGEKDQAKAELIGHTSFSSCVGVHRCVILFRGLCGEK